MAHPHLLDSHSKPGCLSEDLRVDHCAHRLDLDTVEDIAIERFESTINVTDPDPQQDPPEDVPTPKAWIGRARDRVAHYSQHLHRGAHC